jgi:hypothetical protein
VVDIIAAISNLRDAADGADADLDQGLYVAVNETFAFNVSSGDASAGVLSFPAGDQGAFLQGQVQLATSADGRSGTGTVSSWRAALAPGDEFAVAFGRTPAQVLAIVYLGGQGSGGFFPAGLNGLIK